MKSHHQVRTDERDNSRVLRWVVLAIVMLLVGALSYNFFARERAAQPAGAGASQPTAQTSAESASK